MDQAPSQRPLADRFARSEPSLVAAVDQGSSSTKGALLDARTGAVVAAASAPVGIRRDGERAEHDPEALLASVRRVLDELAATGRRPAALALACQRSTCLLWERASGRPLTPALSWQDTTAAARARELAAFAGEIERRSGLRLTAYYAGAKLALLLDETPSARERAARGEIVAGTLDAFLVHRLAGRVATEPGHAGRTLLYDLDGGRWDPWLCARFGVPEAALPELLPSVAERGAVRWGDGESVPLLAVAGDQQAALVGNAAADGGTVVAHFGTGAFVLADAGPAPRRHPGLLAAVTWSRRGERRFQLEGSVNSAGSAVDWAARLAGVALADLPDEPLEPERLPLLLPGFVGVAAPWWAPTPGATLAGVRLEHDGLALVRAALAGVAMRVADCVEALREAGIAPVLLRASGRLATLPSLAGLLADLAGLPVETMAEEEAGLRGAAWLAALGAAEPGREPPPWRPAVAARREPRWSASRRAAARARWRAFAAAAIAATPPAEPP